MELELNKKLINFLNKAYKVDFNKAKILDFSVNKETGSIFLIDCGNDCFIFEFTSSFYLRQAIIYNCYPLFY